jgi:hypothetical protein
LKGYFLVETVINEWEKDHLPGAECSAHASVMSDGYETGDVWIPERSMIGAARAQSWAQAGSLSFMGDSMYRAGAG